MDKMIEEVTSRDPSEQQWRSDIKRLFKRSRIYEGLQRGQKLEEVKELARSPIDNELIDRLIDDLQTRVAVEDPEMVDFVGKLHEKISSKFDFLEATVMLGSSSFGGWCCKENG